MGESGKIEPHREIVLVLKNIAYPTNSAKSWSFRFFVLAMVILAIGMYTSVSISAVGHIFLVASAVLAGKDCLKCWSKSQKALAILIFLSFLSCVVNWEIIDSPFKNILKLKYFLIGLVSASLSQMYLSHENIFSLSDVVKKRLGKLFLATTTIASFSGLIALATGYHPLRLKESCHEIRACGMYGHFISYGYGIFLAVLFIFGLWVYREQVKKWINLPWIVVSLTVNFLGLYLSYTRGALIGFIVSAPFFFFSKKHVKQFFLTLGALISLFVIALSLSWSLRFSFFDIHRVRSNDIRISMYKTALYAFSEKPLLGVGYKNFEPLSKGFKEKYQIEIPEFASHAHSNYFEALASTGILGFLSLVIWLGLWLFETYKRTDWWGKIFFPVVIGIILTGATQYTLGDGENLFVIMSLYALSHVGREKREEVS